MLKFYGIRFNSQGSPERYNVSIALKESLNASLYIQEHYKGDHQKTREAIDREIEQLFQTTRNIGSKKGQLRFLIAKWFRTKDIVDFLLSNPAHVAIKLQIAGILNTSGSIETKWDAVEATMLAFYNQLDPDAQQSVLFDTDAEIHAIMQMVSLLFLEQDEEVPPANIELQFIKRKFPRFVWKKKDGFSAVSDPFWRPNNLYCQQPYLFSRLTVAIHRQQLGNQVGNQVVAAAEKNMTTPVETTFPATAHFPTQAADDIRLELKDAAAGIQRMPLIPETLSETLLSLQNLIQKQYSHDGVKHFLAIIRQISEKRTGTTCRFETRAHFELVARITKKGTCTEKQWMLFDQVFNLLSRLEVKRVWGTGSDSPAERTQNAFILQTGVQASKNDSQFPSKMLLLDPLFAPSEHNPYRLGSHLRLIPGKLFRESSHKHALLPGLSAYLSGSWLNEYQQKQGALEKTAQEIIEGCAFNMTSSNRLRMLSKLNSELTYMDKKSYVGSCRFEKSPAGNPLDDTYSITPPEAVMNLLMDLSAQPAPTLITEPVIV